MGSQTRQNPGFVFINEGRVNPDQGPMVAHWANSGAPYFKSTNYAPEYVRRRPFRGYHFAPSVRTETHSRHATRPPPLRTIAPNGRKSGPERPKARYFIMAPEFVRMPAAVYFCDRHVMTPQSAPYRVDTNGPLISRAPGLKPSCGISEWGFHSFPTRRRR